jgi:RNA binding exosome subunit
MEILILITIAIVCWIHGASIGWKAREKHAEQVLDNFLEKMKEQAKEQSDDLTRITIEKHNGVFYVYNLDTKEFMAQGSTKDEVEDALRARFPEKRFACKHETLEAMGFIS